MIYVCVSVYREELWLEKCIYSIKKSFGKIKHKIIVATGRYKNFPELPKDRTLEIAKDLADEVYEGYEEENLIWDTEQDKRNVYLIAKKETDYYFVIDADEFLKGDFDKSELKEDSYRIMLHRLDGVPPYPIFRIFRHRKGLHYEGAHQTVVLDGKILEKMPMRTIKSVYLEHHLNERKRDRDLAKAQYYRNVKETERGFRNKYGI